MTHIDVQPPAASVCDCGHLRINHQGGKKCRLCGTCLEFVKAEIERAKAIPPQRVRAESHPRVKREPDSSIVLRFIAGENIPLKPQERGAVIMKFYERGDEPVEIAKRMSLTVQTVRTWLSKATA